MIIFMDLIAFSPRFQGYQQHSLSENLIIQGKEYATTYHDPRAYTIASFPRVRAQSQEYAIEEARLFDESIGLPYGERLRTLTSNYTTGIDYQKMGSLGWRRFLISHCFPEVQRGSVVYTSYAIEIALERHLRQDVYRKHNHFLVEAFGSHPCFGLYLPKLDNGVEDTTYQSIWYCMFGGDWEEAVEQFHYLKDLTKYCMDLSSGALFDE